MFGSNLDSVEIDGARHNEAAWAGPVQPVLQFASPKA